MGIEQRRQLMRHVTPLVTDSTVGVSEAHNFNGTGIYRIKVPSPTAAGSITFYESWDDGATYQQVEDGLGNPVSYLVNAGTLVRVAPGDFARTGLLKIVPDLGSGEIFEVIASTFG